MLKKFVKMLWLIKSAYVIYEWSQSEQEDLLMMLSEQDVKLRGYKKIIKGLGQSISDDDDDLDLELSD